MCGLRRAAGTHSGGVREAHIVSCAFLIELGFLNGAEKLAPHPVFSLLKYD